MSLRQSPRKTRAGASGLAATASKSTASTAKTAGKGKTAEEATKDGKNGAKARASVQAVKAEAVSPVLSLRKKRKVESDEEKEEDEDEEDEEEEDDKKKKRKKPAKTAAEQPAKKAKPAKKSGKGSKTQDEKPLAARTDVSTLKKAMHIGAHVSSAGGNAAHIGSNAFALFLKSQRTWTNPPLSDEARDGFRAQCVALDYDAARFCLPHGSYLVNLAQADPAKADQAYGNFVDDLRRCAALGIRLYNFHPGAAVAGTGTRDEAISRIAAALNRAHRETAPSDVVTVIENMAGGGTTVGNRFEELAALIQQVDDKTRVGVCLDTCHAFAAGYDLRTADKLAAVVADFDRIVGLSYLRAVHLNDSKAPLDSRRDLHANIGTGFLGLRAFHALVNHDAFADMPIVLETPIDRPGPAGKTVEDRQVWADEIKLLESLIGMDPDTDAFRAKEEELQAQGAQERKRLQEQVNKKKGKK